MFEGFVHPLLAAGAALCAVPLVIHLLNRRRYRTLPWGAMRFVAAAYRRTRRRAQLESLLLLLLRMALVVLLALALSRPFTDSTSALATLTESRRDVVLLLDVSGSTQYRENVETTFERIRTRAREILSELDPSGDSARLFVCSSQARLLSWRSPAEALSILSTLETPTEESLDLATVLAEVVHTVEKDLEASGALEIRLLTDLQRRNFAGPQGAPSTDPASRVEPVAAGSTDEPETEHALGIEESLTKLQDRGLRIVVEDLGPAATTPANLGVAALTTESPILGPGTPSEISVRIANWGARARNAVRVALLVDGERRPSRQVDVPARDSALVTFPVSFKTSGYHYVEAQLEGDSLDFDDRRGHVFFVPPPARILLVNGAPEPGNIENDEVGFLQAVLEPPSDDPGVGSAFAPFRPRTVYPDQLTTGTLQLSEFDVVVLANVQTLSTSAVETLEAAVASGLSLLITVGDNVTPETYNRRLWRSDGSGLLPAELQRVVRVHSRRESYFRVNEFEVEHPALAFFDDERWRPLFTEVPIYDFIASTPLEDARVLARLDDDGANPLLIERAYDRGRVFLWTTTLDRDWTRLPESPKTLVPLAHELLRYAAQPAAQAPRNVPLGASLVAELRGFPRNPMLLEPDGTHRPLEDSSSVGGDLWRLPIALQAEQRGAWTVELEGRPPLVFAVQTEAEEGDVDRIGVSELASLHPAWLPLNQRGGTDGDEGESVPRSGELWRWFAAATLIALILESLWAARLGQLRRLS